MPQEVISGALWYPLYGREEPLLKEVGGKGLSLIKMAGAALPVPPGFIFTVEFFRPWIDSLKARQDWKDFIASPPGEYPVRCKALKALCAGFTFDESQRRTVQESFTCLEERQREGLFAVRSSSPEEDLEGASFGGLYETVLGVAAGSLEEAVRRCFISCLDERVFLYKHEHGFSTNEARIAVVVQVQVASDVAGVGFSLNPLTNCYDEAVINANWGLGESVVLGMVSPDQFVVDKVKKAIISQKIGKKETAIWLLKDGGTEERPDSRHDEPSLSEAQILELVATITRIEEYYQKPMDTEWAYEEGRLYMLQARPITAYMPLPRQLVTAPGAPKMLYIDATLCIQGLHEPTSVMGTEAIKYILGHLALLAFGRNPLEITFGPGGPDWGGRLFSNLSYSMWLLEKDKFADFLTNMDTVSAEILHGVSEDEYRSGECPPELKGLPFQALTHTPETIVRLFEAAVLPAHLFRTYMKDIQKYIIEIKADEEAQLPLMEFYEKACRHFGHFVLHSTIPVVAVPTVAKGKIRELFKGDSPEIHSQVEHLDRSLPGNVTIEMGLALYHLSTLLEPKDFTSMDDLMEKLKARSLPGKFLIAWDEYMEKYGFRGPSELDIAAPRYRDRPELLIQQVVSAMSMKDSAQNPEVIYERSQKERHKAYDLLSEVAHKKGWAKGREFEMLYRIIETFGGYRETHKYYLIQMVDILRRRILNEAGNLVAEGRLDTPSQVFSITVEDLGKALKDPSMDLRNLVKERGAYVEKLKGVKNFPHIIDSRGKILRPPRKEAKEGELAGEAISPGVARGIVKVLHQPDEKPVNPGDILVARATDPGWTPLFINAAAIVLEVGGMLQHGSLVAREYGKPCVAGIENITSLLKDGQVVEVDGSSGIIRITG
ncbi:MAG: PEP/pyruvate-binding domain-containing protein [Candidatus Eremiobacteraeota bacterium]|nr:PEP/pyruvate-binding domain-containing protein [Candidatus Eremiobacteraeota bacterium]